MRLPGVGILEAPGSASPIPAARLWQAGGRGQSSYGNVSNFYLSPTGVPPASGTDVTGDTYVDAPLSIAVANATQLVLPPVLGYLKIPAGSSFRLEYQDSAIGTWTILEDYSTSAVTRLVYSDGNNFRLNNYGASSVTVLLVPIR
jgi:hypothetical protein